MTLPVMRRLKKQFLSDKNFAGLGAEIKEKYLVKIKAHLDFCKKKVVDQACICAVFFFLAAVRDYLEASPTQREIIVFLTSQEYKALQKQGTLSPGPV